MSCRPPMVLRLRKASRVRKAAWCAYTLRMNEVIRGAIFTRQHFQGCQISYLHVEVAGDLVDGGERLQARRVHRGVARPEGEVLVDLLRGKEGIRWSSWFKLEAVHEWNDV